MTSQPATDAGALPPVPVVDPDSQAYWDFLRNGTLGACRCRECRSWMHPPLERCRHCGGATDIEALSGRGQVFSFVVVRHPAVPGHVPPYTVALVELDEQPGLRMTGVVEADPADVAIGKPVKAVLRPIGTSDFLAPSFEMEPGQTSQTIGSVSRL